MTRRAERAALVSATLAAALVAARSFAGDDGGAAPPRPVRVQTDAQGYFALAADAPAEVWPSDGVHAVVGRFGRFEHPPFEERTHPEAAGATVFVRAQDGSFERRSVQSTTSARPLGELRESFLVAAASWAAARSQFDPGDEEPLSGGCIPSGPPSKDVAADEQRLASLGPYVRFRSTEAAFRFCDVADRIAARLFAIAGDGRDYGTLRWTLHDLTLPAVWSANPEGGRGVDACAVVFPTEIPWRRRPRQVVAMLHIADPELHRMETEAGVAYAALPDHLWKPVDDPWPATRARRNARRVEDGVEYVGTSEDAVKMVVVANEGRLWSRPGTVETARPGAEREAAFLFLPKGVRAQTLDRSGQQFALTRGRADRRAWAHLWRAWTGVDPDAKTRLPLTVPPAGPSALASLVSVRVLTDATGADFVATFEDEAAARAAAAVLGEAAKPFAGAAAVCARNRRDVAPLAVMDRPQKDLAERAFVVLGWKPVCPCGGTYSAHPITRDVSCSVHGTDARPSPERKPLKPVLRDVTTEGAVVRFRVPIDWDR